jgi:hypothetical protein
LGYVGLERLKEVGQSGTPPVGSVAVFLTSLLGQKAFGGHGGDFEAENLSLIGSDGQSDGEGFVLGVFEGLELIELKSGKMGELRAKEIQREPGLLGEEVEFSSDGGAVNGEVASDPAHGDAGGEKEANVFVEVAFLLSEGGLYRGSGEGSAASEATEAGDPVAIGGSVKSTERYGFRSVHRS